MTLNISERLINPNTRILIYDLQTDLGFGKGMSLFVDGLEILKYNLIGDAYEEWCPLNKTFLFPFGITYEEKVNLAFSNMLLHHRNVLDICGITSKVDAEELKDSLYWVKDQFTKLDTKVFISVGGKQERWGNYLGINKHHVEVNGETLLQRMVRLFRSFGITDISLVGWDESYKLPGAKFLSPEVDKSKGDANKYLSSQDYWNKDGRTIIVFGDVYFSDLAVYKMAFDQNRDWTLFGRATNSTIGKTHPELFAISFYPHEIDLIKKCADRCVDLFDKQIANGISLWHLYRALVGLPDELMNKELFGEHIVDIDDLTDDFDLKEDFHRFFSRKDL